MAETTTTIEAIKIDTAPSVKSLADLKKEIKDMKAQLLSLDKTSEEYSQLLSEIGNKQHALKEINEEVTKTNNDFGQSMSNMRGTLAGVSGAIQTVTGVLSLMGVEAGKDSKLLKIMVSAMSITAGIQAVDAGVKSMRALTVSIKAATVASGGLGKALKALAYSNPFTAILAAATAVVAIVAKISSASSEAAEKAREEMEKTDERMRGIADRMKTYFSDTFDTTVQTTVDDMEGWLKAEDKLFEEQMKNAQQTGAMVMQQTQGLLEMSISSFKSQRKLALESNPAWDYTKEGTAAFKKYYADIMELAKVKFREIRFETGEEAAKLRQQYVDEYNKAEKALQDVDKQAAEYNKKQADAARNAKAARERAAKERADQLKRQAENERAYLAKEIAMVKERYEEKGEGNYIPQLLALYDLQLQKEKEAIDAKVKAKEITAEQGEIDKRIAEQKHAADTQAIEDVQTLTRAKEADQQVTLLEADYQQKQYEAQKSYYAQELQWYSQLADSRTTELQAVQIESQQSEAEYQRTMSQMTDRIALLQQYLTLYAEQPDKMAEVQQEISDLQQEMTAVEQEQAKKRIDIAKKEAEAKKNINKKYLQAYQSVSGSVSSVLGSMSDSMEEGTQQWKNLKIAQAIIDTLAGSVTAFTSAMELGVPLGPIVGAAEMAAVLATGFATVAQIRSTQVNKDSAGGGSMPSITVNDQAVNALTNQASNVRLTNTDNDIIDLGEQLKQVKVVVSAREITDTQEDMKRVKVANTF